MSFGAIALELGKAGNPGANPKEIVKNDPPAALFGKNAGFHPFQSSFYPLTSTRAFWKEVYVSADS